MTKTTCTGTVDVPPYTRGDGTPVAGYTRICPYPHEDKKSNAEAKKLKLKQTVSPNRNVILEDVKELKQALHELGYYQPNPQSESVGNFHGYPNSELDDAIRSFQKDNGLTVDGALKPDGETEKAINAEIDGVIERGRNYSPIPQNQNDADDELVKSVIPAIKKHEDTVKHLYVDSKGFVTIGTGKMIDRREDMKNINMITKDGKVATDTEKMEEFDRIKARAEELKTKYPSNDPNKQYNFTYKKYEDATKLRITEKEADRLTQEHIKKDLEDIRKNKFPDFDTYPLNVKQVIIDMQYNMGPGFHDGSPENISKTGKDGWPNFFKYVKAQDWKKAANQTHSPDISKKRNDHRRDTMLDE